MIAAGLLTILGALVPFAVREFSLSEHAVWRVSSAVLGLAVVTQFAFAARGFWPLLERNLIAPRQFEFFLAALSTILTLALAFLATGLLTEPIRAIYGLGVLYLLGLSSHHFFMLILAAQPNR
jgi:hypothetical protein